MSKPFRMTAAQRQAEADSAFEFYNEGPGALLAEDDTEPAEVPAPEGPTVVVDAPAAGDAVLPLTPSASCGTVYSW